MNNFDFLKSVNKDLFEIIEQAEKLYKDEYFEQCMSQTRRFGELVLKDIMGNKCNQSSFDEMINCLKGTSKGRAREKEFIDDLYFLKQNGNKSVHGKKMQQDGMIALECLQRAFEVAINYVTYKNGENKDILKLSYDIDLLLLNKKSEKNLSQKYSTLKEKEIQKKKTKNTQKNKNKNQKIHVQPIINEPDEISLFRKIFLSLIISVIILVSILIYKQFFM